jgi:hypothetical protein
MAIDQLLSQPPAPVRDDGFSQRVLLALYRKRLRRRNAMLAAGAGLALLALIVLSTTTLVLAMPLQLTVLVTSPFIPWLGAVAAMLLLACRPRLLRF